MPTRLNNLREGLKAVLLLAVLLYATNAIIVLHGLTKFGTFRPVIEAKAARIRHDQRLFEICFRALAAQDRQPFAACMAAQAPKVQSFDGLRSVYAITERGVALGQPVSTLAQRQALYARLLRAEHRQQVDPVDNLYCRLSLWRQRGMYLPWPLSVVWVQHHVGRCAVRLASPPGAAVHARAPLVGH
jgi:hypothetical protein